MFYLCMAGHLLKGDGGGHLRVRAVGYQEQGGAAETGTACLRDGDEEGEGAAAVGEGTAGAGQGAPRL